MPAKNFHISAVSNNLIQLNGQLMGLVTFQVVVTDGAPTMWAMDICMAFCFSALFKETGGDDTSGHRKDRHADDEDPSGEKLAQGCYRDHIAIANCCKRHYGPP